jgi:hypothetical protein
LGQELRRKEICSLLGTANDALFGQFLVEEIFKGSCNRCEDIHGLDREHLQDSIPKYRYDIFERRLFTDAFLMSEYGFGHEIVPGEGEHKGDGVGQHAGVLDQIKRLAHNFTLGLNIEQPREGIPQFEVLTGVGVVAPFPQL